MSFSTSEFFIVTFPERDVPLLIDINQLNIVGSSRGRRLELDHQTPHLTDTRVHPPVWFQLFSGGGLWAEDVTFFLFLKDLMISECLTHTRHSLHAIAHAL